MQRRLWSELLKLDTFDRKLIHCLQAPEEVISWQREEGSARRLNDRLRRELSRTVVEKFLAGSVTQAQLARRYDLSPHLIIQWRNNYASGKLADLERRLESHDKAIQSLLNPAKRYSYCKPT